MNNDLLTFITERVLVLDGAMGTSVHALRLSASAYDGHEGCIDYLTITQPDAIEGIHASFLEAGALAVETNTFQASRLKLDEYGLGDRTLEITSAGARLARRVCDRFATPDKPRFVIGSMGPTGMLPSSSDPDLGAIKFETLVDIFAEQARGLLEGGADAILIETAQDILEVKAAIFGTRRAFAESGRRVPLMAQVSLDISGRMLLGTDISAVLTTLTALRVDVVGLNCSTGPDYMRDPIRYLGENSPLPISCVPNAGIPINVGGEAVFPLEPAPFARAMLDFASNHGVAIVGGCCGTTPAHIRLLAEAVAGIKPQPPRGGMLVSASSGMTAVPLIQEPPPMLIGERLNAQGSRAVKRLLLADDYQGLVPIAQEQIDKGAHTLDLCVALNERDDEPAMIAQAAKLLAQSVPAPLVFDSTDAKSLEAALTHYPGSAIVNSINMEDGRKRIEAVMPLVAAHGASVIALTISPEGMAKTAAEKLRVAREIHRIVTEEYGVDPRRLIFDALTFTLATGEAEFRDSAKETLEGIRLIKRELPGVKTTLGLSNVSFGLQPKARQLLNSVFLHHAVQAGLDSAIVNPAHVVPYFALSVEERKLAEDLIYNTSDDALPRLIDYGEASGAKAESKATDDPTASMPAEEAIHFKILHRKGEGIEALIDDALTRHSPVEVLNTVLLPAMKDVGDKFGAGELILPFVLQSAEVMKKSVAHLEKFLDKADATAKGKVVLATVFGDVHDIGKNLVKTILTNNGYTVFDLGKQVPISTILDKARAEKADAIGLSALLVSTSRQMPACVEELHKLGLEFPVIIGGAAINRSFGRRIMYIGGDENVYRPGVFYAKDAFEGLEVIDQLTDANRRPALLERIHEEARQARELAARQAARPRGAGEDVAARSSVSVSVPIPQPPFFGHRALDGIDPYEVWRHLNLKDLFRLSWGGRGKEGSEKWESLVEKDFKPRLAALKAECVQKGYFDLKAVYGYFPCNAEGDSLIVYDPESPEKETARMTFPRQSARDRLCLADYFRPVESGERDVIALQVVTAGPKITEICEKLNAAGKYSEAYFLHGLSVDTAEALASHVHARVRRELKVKKDGGKRYSWGYPACPDLAAHADVWRLLPVAHSIGVQLSDGYQLIPEQSTTAMVVHHPEATYYPMD